MKSVFKISEQPLNTVYYGNKINRFLIKLFDLGGVAAKTIIKKNASAFF
jgi:hypothetical protein